MENDKLFEFMTKMYSEMKEGFSKIDDRFNDVDDRFNKLENEVSKIKLTIENDIKPDIKTSLEGYSQVYEKLEVLEKKVDELAEKQSSQEVEIRVIKGNQKRLTK